MKKFGKKLLFTSVALLLSPALQATEQAESEFGVVVETSCGKKANTIAEKDSGMTSAEYDQYLRDLDNYYCHGNGRPNTRPGKN